MSTLIKKIKKRYLIVTIIVLLILAGISLNLILGDGGILNRATNARKTSDIAGAQEKI